MGANVHGNGARLQIGPWRAPVAILAIALALPHTACLILPARIAAGVDGTVVDAVSGAPVAGAVVVVRFDGHYDDVLPDREVIGHLEAHTDATGRFSVGPVVRSGLSLWPMFKTEARVVSVLKEGYRCARPVAIRTRKALKIRLHPALDIADRRTSCRPIPANPGEAEDYMAAWRALFPREEQSRDEESERQIVRILEARSVLGFGENCEGPVIDLALAPEGTRAAFVAVASTPEVRIVELTPDGPRPSQFVAHDESFPPRRIAWTSPGDLVLWEPSPDAYRSVSPSIFGSDRFEVVWRARAEPVAAAGAPTFHSSRAKTREESPQSPLDPADLNDEGDSLWLGRTFLLKRSLNPETGLSADVLHVVRQDGSHYEIPLPGEACGPNGRFGRPHYRVVAGGNSGIDLRFVEGGCHAILIDLRTGSWKKLDESGKSAVCRESRSVPASHFNAALRSYAREVQVARSEAGGDPSASYALIVDPDRTTHVETRGFAGEAITAPVADFPLSTPLRRIDVAVVGTVYNAPRAPEATRRGNILNPL